MLEWSCSCGFGLIDLDIDNKGMLKGNSRKRNIDEDAWKSGRLLLSYNDSTVEAEDDYNGGHMGSVREYLPIAVVILSGRSQIRASAVGL